MSVKKVERFYKYVLLPRVREDTRKNKRLHFALYQSLKKAVYKPAAFNKGILFSLCECCITEARGDGVLWHNKIAISASNTGSVWDNAKKYIDAGALEHASTLGPKGSEPHKAAVIGGTIGDPLKDTSGPSLNILIKLMTRGP